MILGILAILGILLAVIVVTGLAVSAIGRDKSHGTSGTLSSAMLEVQSVLEPGKKKVVETMHEMEEREEEDESGED